MSAEITMTTTMKSKQRADRFVWSPGDLKLVKRGPGRPRKTDSADRKPVQFRLDSRLHARMKARAAIEGRTLLEAMEQAMAEYLERHR